MKNSAPRRWIAAVAVPLLVLAGCAAEFSAQANTTYTIASNRNVPWTQTVTLPEFPPDSQLLANLRITSTGDAWDRTGRVWIQTPAGKVDLFPFVTGFGGDYWNDPVDVSALRPLLKGSVTFGGTVDNTGWKMTLTIEEVPGGNSSRKAIWAAKSITSGTVWADGQGDAGPKGYGFTIPTNWPAAMFSKVYLTFFADGHGGSDGTGCCEFDTGTFQIWADGTSVKTMDPWRNATDQFRSRNPTSGRWDGNNDGDTTDAYPTDYWSSDFARSGWLPGDYVHPAVVDITGALGTIPGNHTISYDYLDNIGVNGGFWFLSSYVSATLSSAAPLATTTTLAPSANPSGLGNLVTFTAVALFNGVAVGGSGGTMTFLDGTNALGTSTVSDGVATFATSALAQGSHIITAQYSGNVPFYQASTSAPLAQVIQPTTTTTTAFSAAPSPSAVGSNVTFTATVLVNGLLLNSATGTMVFKDNTTRLRTNAVSGGVSTFTTSALAYGSHLMRSEYSGYSSYLASTSAPLAQLVLTPTATTMALSSSPNPSAIGSNVTFTATVQVSGVTASSAGGTVVFKDGITPVSTNTVSSGVASFATSALTYGSHLLNVEYGGYGPYLASTSAPVAQTVSTPVVTSLTLVSSPNSSVVDNDVTYIVTVNPSWAAGAVVLKEDGAALDTNTLSGGLVTFTNNYSSPGSYLMTAEYSGYGIYLASTSAPVVQVVHLPLPDRPTILAWNVSGVSLTLNWPPDYQGWILQVQTNAQGLGTNWADIAGSDGVTSTNLPIVPANPSAFYRLRHP